MRFLTLFSVLFVLSSFTNRNIIFRDFSVPKTGCFVLIGTIYIKRRLKKQEILLLYFRKALSLQRFRNIIVW